MLGLRCSVNPAFSRIARREKVTCSKWIPEHPGLIVDIVKQGSDATNDGNMAQNFFEY